MSAAPKSEITYATYWRGRPLSDLNKEELIEAVEWLAEENQRLRSRASEDMAQWMQLARAGRR